MTHKLQRTALGAAAVSLMIAWGTAAQADFAGVQPSFQNPKSTLDGTGSMSYDVATRAFTLEGHPYVTYFAPNAPTFWDFASPRSVTISFTVGACTPSDTGAVSCAAQPGPGDDLVVTGGVGAYPYSAGQPLLTGEIVEFGFSNTSGTTDYFDFRFVVTGGSMAGEFPGGEVGMYNVVESSTFSGSFARSFTSTRIKGDFASLPGNPAPQTDAELGDRVWEDLNGDGVQDCADPSGDGIIGNAGDTGAECSTGIAGVDVDLYLPGPDGECATGDEEGPILTATTDAQGFYSHGTLPAGDYCVGFHAPVDLCGAGADGLFTAANQGSDDALDSDAEPATGLVASKITLAGGDVNLSVDAGVYCQAHVGDRIWNDSPTPDGVQSTFTIGPLAEPGIEGLTVELYRCDALDGTAGASPVQTTVTGTDGIYGFGVAPGVYDIAFSKPSDPNVFGDDYSYTLLMSDLGDAANDSDADLITGRTGCIIEISSGEDDLTWDAGVIEPPADPLFSSLGDRLFEDVNRNGVQDTNEPSVDGTRYPSQVRVLENPDRDQTCTSGDEVQLMHPLTGEPVVLDIDGNGNYKAEQMLPGSYCVEFDLPAGDFCAFGRPQFTLADQGGDDAVDSDVTPFAGNPSSARSENIVLFPDTTDLTWDAGVYCGARIGDRFWNDSANPDGVQSADTVAEPGIDGVTVNLYQCTDDANVDAAPVQSTSTAGGGYYSFIVEPGQPYVVEFVLSDALKSQGYQLTGQNQGSDDAADSDVDSATGRTACQILVGSNEEDLTWDGGAWLPDGSLGDRLFHDRNANGIQETGEEGVDGGSVELFANPGGGACEALPEDFLAGATTADGGLYQYVNLPAGDYCLRFTAPADFCATGSVRFSRQGQGGDAALDSDVAPATGLTGNIALPLNGQDMTWDAGIYCGARLGDRVWEDLDGDGVQDCADTNMSGIIGDAGDTDTECGLGFADVPVDLLDTGTDGLCNTGDEGVLGSTSTDADGFYLFDDLEPGSYCVQIERPLGYSCTLANMGGDDAADSDMVAVDGTSLCQTDNADQNPILLASGEDDRAWDAGLVLSEVAPPTGGTQGCTPGYWRQPQHFFAWTAPYSPENPATPFGDVFADQFGGKSLLEVVWLGGGGKNALGRHAVAALLNAASEDVDYPYSVAEIVALTNAALNGGDIEAQKDEFDAFNNLGCPLGNGKGDTSGDTGGDTGSDTGGDTGSDTGGDTGGDTGDDTGGDTGGDTGTCVTPSIDGDVGDWDLTADFFANMHEAGKSNKDLLATAYVRYAAGRLNVLVLTTAGNLADQRADDAWVKIYDLGSSTQVDGSAADFAWVYDSNGQRIGYEASFPLTAGSYDQMEIHLSVNGGDTASTGKKKQDYVSLTATETCPVGAG